MSLHLQSTNTIIEFSTTRCQVMSVSVFFRLKIVEKITKITSIKTKITPLDTFWIIYPYWDWKVHETDFVKSSL